MGSPFFLKTQVISPSVLAGFVFDVIGYEESGSGHIDTAPSLSSSDFENPVIGVETEWKNAYVSLAMCSKRTLLLRCLSKWRRRSSGVCLVYYLRVLVAGMYRAGTSFQAD